MARTCCLAGIDSSMVPLLSNVLKAAGELPLATLTRLDVAELRRVAPDLLVCDVDGIAVDPLELLRQVRFVLPDSLIAVYTGVMKRTWGVACHFAGANCLLSKDSTVAQLAEGLESALLSGCYTDPRFAA
jgi:DNA-binding NarL/FixJ family response regulator